MHGSDITYRGFFNDARLTRINYNVSARKKRRISDTNIGNIESAFFLNIWVIIIFKYKLLFGEKCLYFYTLERENVSKCVTQVDYLIMYFTITKWCGK